MKDSSFMDPAFAGQNMNEPDELPASGQMVIVPDDLPDGDRPGFTVRPGREGRPEVCFLQR
jgi:hypothetical protein